MELLLGYASLGAVALAYLGLALYYLLRGRWGQHGAYLMVAILLTASWGGLSLLGHDIIPRYQGATLMLRHLAMLAWVWLLWHLIASLQPHRKNFPRRLLIGRLFLLGLTATTVLLLGVHLAVAEGPPQLLIMLGLTIAAVGLSLTETLYRSYQPLDRWGVKFLCLATGGLFGYDVFLYGDGILFGALDPALLDVRGLAQALVAPLLATNIHRSEARHFTLGLSQRFVFGSIVLFGVGFYLAVMAGSAYFVRSIGEAWGSAVQAVFLFAAVLVLLVFLLSGALRARLRHFLSHHILRDKYDYRAEWLRFTERLALADATEPFDFRIVRALADIVDSPAGALWDVSEAHLPIAAGWNLTPASLMGLDMQALAGFFEKDNHIRDLTRPDAFPEDAPQACHELAAMLRQIPQAWALIPLLHRERLIAILVLSIPRSGQQLSSEDSELLQTASRQAAGYLSEQRSTRALAEVREFEKFNQRYAFVAHDIKNLVSQLSLIIRNAEKFGERPDFQRDMLATVQSAVARMHHLMQRLNTNPDSSEVEIVAIKPLIEKLIEERSQGDITISLECAFDVAGLRVRADSRRVDAILRHLFQNALESPGNDGKIVIGLRRERNSAVIEVRDSGKGMDPEFIRSELFRPFRSTKRGGMGIGAYQCRTYARELGGDLEAISSVGAGTTMRVTLPLLRDT